MRFSSCLNRKFLGLFCGCNFMFEQFTDVNAATFLKQAATASGVHLNRPGGVETCSFDLPDAADVTQGFFSLRYASTTPVRYSASRSLMATISDKVKGSGCWAQLTGQFAAEEMISVTCACKSTGVGRAMVFPPFIVDLLGIHKSRRAAEIQCGIDGYEGIAGGTQNNFDQPHPRRQSATTWNANESRY